MQLSSKGIPDRGKGSGKREGCFLAHISLVSSGCGLYFCFICELACAFCFVHPISRQCRLASTGRLLLLNNKKTDDFSALSPCKT